MIEAPVALLPYHQPAVATILVQTSFIIVLNVINYVLDYIIYCGLLGQILVGVVWGAPGAEWLGKGVQESVVQVGYLGLVFLVYEGRCLPFPASLWLGISLTMNRWAFNIGRLIEGKPTPLNGHSCDRCWAANCILIFSRNPGDGNPSAGIYCRCCFVLDQLRDNIYDPWHHRAYQNKNRYCPDKRNHAG